MNLAWKASDIHIFLRQSTMAGLSVSQLSFSWMRRWDRATPWYWSSWHLTWAVAPSSVVRIWVCIKDSKRETWSAVMLITCQDVLLRNQNLRNTWGLSSTICTCSKAHKMKYYLKVTIFGRRWYFCKLVQFRTSALSLAYTKFSTSKMFLHVSQNSRKNICYFYCRALLLLYLIPDIKCMTVLYIYMYMYMYMHVHILAKPCRSNM